MPKLSQIFFYKEKVMIRGKISVAQAKGPRLTQEDRYVYFPVRSEVSSLSGWLIAVMDGHTHMGYDSAVSELCRQSVPKIFAIRYVEQAEQRLQELVQGLNRVAQHYYQGSTISIALLLESHEQATFTTVGDSPIVLIGTHEEFILPVHSARSNVGEVEDAISRGGVLADNMIWIVDSDTPRWDGEPHGQQPTRSLGDFCMGDVISRTPEIITTALSGDSQVLLCTDGMCDISKDEHQTIFAGLFDVVRGGADAQDLLNWRIEGGRLTDNATAVLWSPL